MIAGWIVRLRDRAALWRGSRSRIFRTMQRQKSRVFGICFSHIRYMKNLDPLK
jgi:hypothetical protein